jgi:hypothetical protein
LILEKYLNFIIYRNVNINTLDPIFYIFWSFKRVAIMVINK